MTLQPGMTSVRQGVSVVGGLKCRAWRGLVADLWQAECAPGARGHYVSPHPRMFIVLDRAGGDFETRLRPDAPGRRSGQGALSYIPAGVPVWGRSEGTLSIRHLDIHFDAEQLAERLATRLDPGLLAEPRIMFADERMLTLARLIAEECAAPQPRHDLYGEGLAIALLISLFALEPPEPRRHTPLAGWQLRRVTDYITANCARSIRLQELAELVGLSQSYFSHAFKAATGLPPHQWQMQARVRRGQDLLVRGDRPLSSIAAETGFSDQAHFTRVFRRFVGVTPAAWQREHRTVRPVPER